MHISPAKLRSDAHRIAYTLALRYSLSERTALSGEVLTHSAKLKRKEQERG